MPHIIDSSSFSHKYKGNEDYPLLITPEIYQWMRYKNIPETTNDIVFFGFNKTNPLYLPKGHVFKGPVWVVGCILAGLKGVTLCKEINLVRSFVSVSCEEAVLKSVKIMDESSFEEYKTFKLENRINDNVGIILHSDKTQIDRLDAVMCKCPLFELNSVIKEKIITEDIELKGPYPFSVSNHTVFKEKVSVIDIFKQTFDKSVTFEKGLFNLGIY
jgi:hypothetical protein